MIAPAWSTAWGRDSMNVWINDRHSSNTSFLPIKLQKIIFNIELDAGLSICHRQSMSVNVIHSLLCFRQAVLVSVSLLVSLSLSTSSSLCLCNSVFVSLPLSVYSKCPVSFLSIPVFPLLLLGVLLLLLLLFVLMLSMKKNRKKWSIPWLPLNQSFTVWWLCPLEELL